MITVVSAGPLTTVQDLGRPGHAHLGVPLAGAVDRPALRAANRLVGNDPSAACLETTLVGPVLRFAWPTVVAVTGARCPVLVDGAPAPFGTAVLVRSSLSLGPVTSGVRSYVAVRGGVDVAPVLGSRSTCTLSGLGPAPLRDGDVLPVGKAQGVVGEELLPPVVEAPVLRVLLGPRDDGFADASALGAGPYAVTPSSDRTGVRLSGPPLARVSDAELLSEGVVPGAVQVPPDGQPIVFLANCPTTGGYPVVAVVLPEDLPHAAQARPGTALRFAVVG